MALIHPQLYEDGLDVLNAMKEDTRTAEWASKWASICTGICVICNRVTAPHRDTGGKHGWYDLLGVFGNYGKASLDIINLGAEFAYPAGTVVGFCGRILEHAVRNWGHGDRICYAQFFRTATFDVFKKTSAEWMTRDIYNKSVQ
jgi:hypothetical protein